jgi:hypothetical protein
MTGTTVKIQYIYYHHNIINTFIHSFRMPGNSESKQASASVDNNKNNIINQKDKDKNKIKDNNKPDEKKKESKPKSEKGIGNDKSNNKEEDDDKGPLDEKGNPFPIENPEGGDPICPGGYKIDYQFDPINDPINPPFRCIPSLKDPNDGVAGKLLAMANNPSAGVADLATGGIPITGGRRKPTTTTTTTRRRRRRHRNRNRSRSKRRTHRTRR